MVVGLADLISLEAEVAQLPGSSDEDSPDLTRAGIQ